MYSYYWKKNIDTNTQINKQANKHTNISLEWETTLPISLVSNCKKSLEIPKGYLEGIKEVAIMYQRGKQKIPKE